MAQEAGHNIDICELPIVINQYHIQEIRWSNNMYETTVIPLRTLADEEKFRLLCSPYSQQPQLQKRINLLERNIIPMFNATNPNEGYYFTASDSGKLIGASAVGISADGQVNESYTIVDSRYSGKGVGSSLILARHKMLKSVGIEGYHAVLVGGQTMLDRLNVPYIPDPTPIEPDRYYIDISM